MVVVRAVTFNFISALKVALWSTTTIQSEKASNPYECGLACDSFVDCGGFKWEEGQCQLVARLSEAGEVGTLNSNLYRMATFRGRRIIDGYKKPSVFRYWQYKQACDDWGMMMLPPPLSVREKLTVSIRYENYMHIGGGLNSTGFTDDFGNTYPLNSAVITWTVLPIADDDIVLLAKGFLWKPYIGGKTPTTHLMCMEKD